MSVTATTAMPGTVARAQQLTFALVGVYVVQTVVAFVASDALVDHWAQAHNYTGEFADLADSAAPAYGWVALISLVLFGGLLLLSALSFPKRATWARVVAIVFGVLAFLGGLLAFAQGAPIWYAAIVVIAGLLGLGVAVLLLLGESSRWFSGRSTPSSPAPAQ